MCFGKPRLGCVPFSSLFTLVRLGDEKKDTKLENPVFKTLECKTNARRLYTWRCKPFFGEPKLSFSIRAKDFINTCHSNRNNCRKRDFFLQLPNTKTICLNESFRGSVSSRQHRQNVVPSLSSPHGVIKLLGSLPKWITRQ